MGEKRFRDSDGNLLCDRCHGPIVQPPTGRRRLYCSRNCRELAYRTRKLDSAVNEAVKAATAPDTSVVETQVASVDETVASVDETRRPVPKPRRKGRHDGVRMTWGDLA